MNGIGGNTMTPMQPMKGIETPQINFMMGSSASMPNYRRFLPMPASRPVQLQQRVSPGTQTAPIFAMANQQAMAKKQDEQANQMLQQAKMGQDVPSYPMPSHPPSMFQLGSAATIPPAALYYLALNPAIATAKGVRRGDALGSGKRTFLKGLGGATGAIAGPQLVRKMFPTRNLGPSAGILGGAGSSVGGSLLGYWLASKLVGE